MKSIKYVSYLRAMESNSFYKKVITFLSQVNKGTHTQLLEDGWITREDANKINAILMDLGLVEKKNERTSLTRKGLNILLYYKMGKINQHYNKEILTLFLTDDRP